MGDRQLRARLIRASCVAVVVAAVVASGTALAASQAVAISGFAFSPSAVTVSVGDTVTWTNSDAVVHTATADDASWDAGNIAAGGGTGAVVFTTAGSFPYHCSIHSQMTGTVTVGAVAATPAPTAASTISPTDTAPILGGSTTPGGGLLSALVIAAVALAVATAVLRRPLAPTMAQAVAVQATGETGGVKTPPIYPAPSQTDRISLDLALGPIVVVAIASAVAVAVVWRKRTSGR